LPRRAYPGRSGIAVAVFELDEIAMFAANVTYGQVVKRHQQRRKRDHHERQKSGVGTRGTTGECRGRSSGASRAAHQIVVIAIRRRAPRQVGHLDRRCSDDPAETRNRQVLARRAAHRKALAS